MLRRFFAFLLMVGLNATMTGAPADLARVPDVIESEIPGVAPAWVAADIAVASDGNLRADLFDAGSIASIRRYLNNQAARRKAARTEAERDECAVTLGRTLEQFSSTASADHLVTNSSYIIRASVAGLREGFLFGTPGTLIALDGDEWLKRENADVSERPAYLFFPNARISTPRGTICANHGRTYRPPRKAISC